MKVLYKMFMIIYLDVTQSSFVNIAALIFVAAAKC